MRSTTNCVCCCSSRAATSHGASPPVRSVQRFLVNRSAAREMSVLVTLEDRLRRAVVLLERDDRRAGELLREVEDVPEVRAAEGVDALRVVSDDRDVAVRLAHSAKNPRLQHVRVLIFVHEDVVVQPGDLLPELRRRLEHQRPEEQQVVVVDEIPLLLPAACSRRKSS